MEAKRFFPLPPGTRLPLACSRWRHEKKHLVSLYQGGALLLLFLAFLGITGCATSMGVQKVDIRETYEQITVNAISADIYSKFSHDVLIRHNLVQTFNDDPRQVFILLHREAEKGDRRDLLFALSELNYLVGMRSRKSGIERSPYFFASALYAYFYLLDKQTSLPDPFDRRFRVACDLYNSAVGQALADKEGELRIAPDEVELPVGKFGFTLETAKFPEDLKKFEKFVSADQFKVKGLSLRDRDAGLGAPIIAVEKKKKGDPMFRTFPASLFLRVNCRLQEVAKGTCTGTLELYSTYDHIRIVAGDKKIPLERDLTAQLAYTLDQPYVQGLGFNEFLYGTGYVKTGIYPMQPFEYGKIPVVFVHGTFSSPVAWAEMVNSLRGDPLIAGKYQFWNFFYDSGKRIGLSAQELRASLTELVNRLDPEGTNVPLHQMIVIGHSQGGLLAKFTATDTGDAFVRMATGKSLAELNLSEKEKTNLEKEAIVKPLLFVKRVVFIATPHRGSHLSRNWVRKLVLKVVKFPQTVLQSTANLKNTVTKLGVSEAYAHQLISATSLDAMSPDNPTFKILADIPLAKGITGHSIIAIDGNDTPPEGDDGVVKYTSAHVDYVESEFIVRSGHSCQSKPLVIEEVRRILLEHLQQNSQPSA